MSDLTDIATRVLAVAGATSGLLTLLGTVLPADWAVTRLCARLGADIRGILLAVRR